jgi:hypothetical protein
VTLHVLMMPAPRRNGEGQTIRGSSMAHLNRKRLATRLMAMATLCVSGGAFAQAYVSMPAGPLRLQNYPGGTSIFNAGSPCTSGGLTLDPTDTPDRNKTLYATVLAAKASNALFFAYYDVGAIAGAPVCYIRSFGIDAQ